MNKLHRQILTLGVCFAAAMAARVYFDRTAEKIERDAASEIVEQPAPDAAVATSGAERDPAAAALEVELPQDGRSAAALPGEPAAKSVAPPVVAKGASAP